MSKSSDQQPTNMPHKTSAQILQELLANVSQSVSTPDRLVSVRLNPFMASIKQDGVNDLKVSLTFSTDDVAFAFVTMTRSVAHTNRRRPPASVLIDFCTVDTSIEDTTIGRDDKHISIYRNTIRSMELSVWFMKAIHESRPFAKAIDELYEKVRDIAYDFHWMADHSIVNNVPE